MAVVAPNPPGSSPPSPPVGASPAPRGAEGSGQASGLAVLTRLLRVSSTPGWLRSIGGGIILGLLIFTVVGVQSALQGQDATATIENNTAPALVEVQGVFASVAEANASATGAVLTESRAQRNLYLDAISRAARQSERVSSLVGDAPDAHAALQDLNAGLVRYSGEIEASRAISGLDATDPATDEDETAEGEAAEDAETTPGAASQVATDGLASAFAIARTDVATAVDTVTASGQAELDEQQARVGGGTILTLLVGAVTLVALLVFQVLLTSRTNRILHPWLILASLLLLAAMVVHTSSLSRSQTALEEAEAGGFDSITSTADIQAAAYDLQTDLAFATLRQETIDTGAAFAQVEQGIQKAELLADSTRERAAVDTLRIRWDRYRAEVEAIASDGSPAALDRLQGEGLSAFNGFNTSIESVLSDNRTQFLDGAAGATAAVRWLPASTVLLSLLSALCVFAGVSRRLREYR